MDTFQSCQKDNLKMLTYRYLLDSTATWVITVASLSFNIVMHTKSRQNPLALTFATVVFDMQTIPFVSNYNGRHVGVRKLNEINVRLLQKQST